MFHGVVRQVVVSAWTSRKVRQQAKPQKLLEELEELEEEEEEEVSLVPARLV